MIQNDFTKRNMRLEAGLHVEARFQRASDGGILPPVAKGNTS